MSSLGALDSVATRIRNVKKADFKPSMHHFFYFVVWAIGWLAPPLAILVRFGIGKDFFINIVLTLCGYFPGHFHNFYCQSVRNNDNKKRTPKWAVKYGLVRVKDRRGGKHAWAHRYDETLPDSSRQGYGFGDSAEDIPANRNPYSTSDWDGHGPEPSKKPESHIHNHRAPWNVMPWDNVVDPTQVQGGPRPDGRSDFRNNDPMERDADPFTNEQFYNNSPHLSRTNSRTNDDYGGKKKGTIKGFFSKKEKDRYAPEDVTPRRNDDYIDEFEREINGLDISGPSQPTRQTTAYEPRPQESAWNVKKKNDEYMDDFEREINGGNRGKSPVRSTAGYNSTRRRDSFDQFEDEITGRNGASRYPHSNSGYSGSSSAYNTKQITPQRTGVVQGSKEDRDLFNHTF